MSLRAKIAKSNLKIGCKEAPGSRPVHSRRGDSLGPASDNAAEERRPNIIFLLTDDHQWDALGAMGNPIIRTPHLDTMAQEGYLFRNAYVTTSICAVSRASLLSGQYQLRHEIADFKTDFSEAALTATYPMVLKAQGYHIGFIGKSAQTRCEIRLLLENGLVIGHKPALY